MPSMKGSKAWHHFFQAPQGDSSVGGRLTRARPVQLAQPSMNGGSTGHFSLDEPRYFVKNQHSNFLFVFFLEDSAAPTTILHHPLAQSMCFVKSFVKVKRKSTRLERIISCFFFVVVVQNWSKWHSGHPNFEFFQGSMPRTP